jgi:lantibiotic biosynthesis protein
VSSTISTAASSAVRRRSHDRAFAIGERLLVTANDVDRGLAGNAGDAVAYLALTLATGDTKYEAAMHAALKRAAAGDYPPSIGMFDGMSGLRVAAELATTIEPRYRGLVEKCDAFVEAQLPLTPAKPDSYCVFDVMQGWAGARLARGIRGPLEPDRLTALLSWLVADSHRWECPHPAYQTDRPVRDLGLAHGIAGVLSSLVLTHERLESSVGESARDAANFLASRAVESNASVMWPHSAGRDPEQRYLSAWCYGTPGVASALYGAARMLGDVSLAAFALDAARGIARLPAGEWLVSELGLCHGLMGNALCFASLGAAADCAELRAAAERLVIETLDQLDADAGVCYTRETEAPYAATNELKGIAGIALALLTLSGDMPSDWMRAHALQPL